MLPHPRIIGPCLQCACLLVMPGLLWAGSPLTPDKPRKPIDVYIFAGQSNMGGGINLKHKHSDEPAYQWMHSDRNNVLYFWFRGSEETDQWEVLTDETHREGHWEQVTAHYLWTHAQEAKPAQRIAIITVTVGATAMADYWTAGGRAAREGMKDWIKTRKQGKGNAHFQRIVTKAFSQLKELGYAPDLEAVTWYQGEGDSLHQFHADNYLRYLKDMIDGWEDRDLSRFKDDRELYAGSIADWTGDKDFRVVIVRVSDNIKGASSWGPRHQWDPALQTVRKAQVNYAEKRDNAAWVDVDDLPLRDAFHFADPEYIEIGKRVAKALLQEDPRTEQAKDVWWKDTIPETEASVPTPKMRGREINTWWKKTHEKIVRDAKANSRTRLVFVGDSITDYFDAAPKEKGGSGGLTVWKKYYTPRQALNAGIAGDTTEQVLWRLQNGLLDALKDPRVFVLTIGHNNRQAPEAIASGMLALLKEIRTRFPSASIIFIPHFPTTRSYWSTSRQIKAYNIAVKTVKGDPRIIPLDLNKGFLSKEGILKDQELIPDNVHPAEAGYRAWAEGMEPTLQKLLDE
jgi:lysophospholipase L1-like esterase